VLGVGEVVVERVQNEHWCLDVAERIWTCRSCGFPPCSACDSSAWSRGAQPRPSKCPSTCTVVSTSQEYR
jgi:hypothetical protein